MKLLMAGGLIFATACALPAVAADSPFRKAMDDKDFEKALDTIDTEVNFGPRNDEDIAPLCQAVRVWGSQGFELTLALLNRGVSPDTPCGGKHTALYEAARFGRMEIVSLLVDRGADVNLDRSGIGDMPLTVAYFEGYDRLAQYLEERGATAPVTMLSTAKKYRAMEDEKHRLRVAIPPDTDDIERQRLQFEITLKALLYSKRHEADPYRQMYERMYIERATQESYDPAADGPVAPFLSATIMHAMEETAKLLERQGNWHPERLRQSLPTATDR